MHIYGHDMGLRAYVYCAPRLYRFRFHIHIHFLLHFYFLLQLQLRLQLRARNRGVIYLDEYLLDN